MKSVEFTNPQTLNLYAYCANDPVNHTDPAGLGFFSSLAKFFKAVGHVLSVVGNAIARVLNNRWVRIGVLILGFLVPFLGALAKAIQLALKIYNIVADFAGQMQLYGMLLQGKFKQLGMALLSGYVGSLVATIENGIIEGLQNYIGKTTVNGQSYIDWSKFSVKDFAHGVWEGFKTGLGDAANQLFRYRTESGAPKKSFWRKLKDAVVPGYGHYCGPGIGLGAAETRDPVSDLDDRCKGHDADRPALGYKKADKILFESFLTLHSAPRLNFIDIAFGGRPSVGSSYKFGATSLFGGIVAFRKIRGWVH
jgi:hypothetical protein